jgi:hypothetical protein
MNDEIHDDHHEPDYEAAHYASYHNIYKHDLELGVFNCTNYFLDFHNQLGEQVPLMTKELMSALDSIPTLGSDIAEAQNLAETFARSNLTVPAGLDELPLNWGYVIRRFMLETHWPDFENCTIKDVFGWSYVSRFCGFLHIHYEEPLYRKVMQWSQIGSLILEMHRQLEPGPYTPHSRLCDFT